MVVRVNLMLQPMVGAQDMAVSARKVNAANCRPNYKLVVIGDSVGSATRTILVRTSVRSNVQIVSLQDLIADVVMRRACRTRMQHSEVLISAGHFPAGLLEA